MHPAPLKLLLEDEDTIVIKTRLTTVIEAYYNLDHTAVDIIESLGNAMKIIQQKENMILAGDFNCLIDKMGRKVEEVLSYLREERLTLLNSQKDWTYMCHNGGSTVDLIFTQGF